MFGLHDVPLKCRVMTLFSVFVTKTSKDLGSVETAEGADLYKPPFKSSEDHVDQTPPLKEVRARFF